jgi:DNA-binding response OmpR family regulator
LPASRSVLSKPAVLIVDGDPGVRVTLHLILDDYFEVLDAGDARSALAVVSRRPVHLVLVDILLPGIDGIELLRKLKATLPAIPVIIVTSVKTVSSAVTAMQAGAADYVTKPFGEEDLRARVRRALGAITIGAVIARSSGKPPIALVDGDPARRATLSVLLAPVAPVVTYHNRGTSPDAGASISLLCLVITTRDDLSLAAKLRARHPHCPAVLVLTSDEGRLHEHVEALEICDTVRPPFEVADIVRHASASLTLAVRPPLGRFTRSVVQTIGYVTAHFGEPLSVEHLAKVAGVSASHLAHTFPAQTGLTVKAFVTGVRLEIAKHLLSTTEDKLAYVAKRTGFFDASHLGRVFRRSVGQRPTTYRSHVG